EPVERHRDHQPYPGHVASSSHAADFWAPSFYELLNLLPGDKGDVVVLQGLLELGTRHDVDVSLTPCGTIRLVVHHHRLQLGVIVSEVNDHLGDGAWLEAGDTVEVELLPLVSRNGFIRDDHRIQRDIVGCEWHRLSAKREGLEREEGQPIIARN